MNEEEPIVRPPMPDESVLVRITAGTMEALVSAANTSARTNHLTWGTPDEKDGAYTPMIWTQYGDEEEGDGTAWVIFIVAAVFTLGIIVGVSVGLSL